MLGLRKGGKRLAKSPSRESVSIFLTPPGYVPNKEHRGLSLWGRWAQQNAESWYSKCSNRDLGRQISV
ncbi:hypothetical protein PBY51_003812 [Eleginops maclovinus]|uniref:Uncharacterized protein n=1 Tax=Eleginops maclovinus TaxID=56733 RepID=A0AAN7Y262_ELEMC|nr:hypothetical protein PBY51_003812 [Eleginops maclovinus]